jgi:hypothetical protein
MGQDVADLGLKKLTCTTGGHQWYVIHIDNGSVEGIEAVTDTEASDLHTQAGVSYAAFSSEANGTLDMWSGLTGSEKQALYEDAGGT